MAELLLKRSRAVHLAERAAAIMEHVIGRRPSLEEVVEMALEELLAKLYSAYDPLPVWF